MTPQGHGGHDRARRRRADGHLQRADPPLLRLDGRPAGRRLRPGGQPGPGRHPRGDGRVAGMRSSGCSTFFATYVRAEQDWAFQLWLDAWAEAARRPAVQATSRRLNVAWQQLLATDDPRGRRGGDHGLRRAGGCGVADPVACWTAWRCRPSRTGCDRPAGGDRLVGGPCRDRVGACSRVSERPRRAYDAPSFAFRIRGFAGVDDRARVSVAGSGLTELCASATPATSTATPMPPAPNTPTRIAMHASQAGCRSAWVSPDPSRKFS